MRVKQTTLSGKAARLLVVGVALGWPLAVAGPALADNYPVTTGSLTSSVGGSTATALSAGSSVHISGGGFAPGATVTITLHSTPVTLGTVTASGAGTISADVVLPAGTVNGSHTLQADGAAPGGGTNTLTEQVTVSGGVTADRGGLAFTGADVGVIGAIGGGAIVAGIGTIMVTRRARARA